MPGSLEGFISIRPVMLVMTMKRELVDGVPVPVNYKAMTDRLSCNLKTLIICSFCHVLCTTPSVRQFTSLSASVHPCMPSCLPGCLSVVSLLTVSDRVVVI